jgi:hypothetical protein
VSVIDDADVDAAASPVGAAGTVGGGGVVVVSPGGVVTPPFSALPPQAERHRTHSKIDVDRKLIDGIGSLEVSRARQTGRAHGDGRAHQLYDARMPEQVIQGGGGSWWGARCGTVLRGPLDDRN